MIDNDDEPSSITFFDALDMLVSDAVANASEDEIEPAEITKDIVTAMVCHAYFLAASIMSAADATALVHASLQIVSEFDGRKARLDA